MAAECPSGQHTSSLPRGTSLLQSQLGSQPGAAQLLSLKKKKKNHRVYQLIQTSSVGGANTNREAERLRTKVTPTLKCLVGAE